MKRRQEKISLSTNANHTKLRFIRISKGKRRVSAGTAAADGKAAVVHSPEDSSLRTPECRIAGGRRRQERGESEAHQRVSDDDTEETIEELSGREAELGDADKNN